MIVQEKKRILTIGHSTKNIQAFITLLKLHRVEALCDVRSSPYSRYTPQFNRPALITSLQKHHIRYVFLGKELGARTKDPICYRDKKVQYDILAQTKLFQKGLSRIRVGSKDYNIALMCAEQEPLECHRCILVSKELVSLGFDVEHILGDGTSENHQKSLTRLRKLLKFDNSDLFINKRQLEEKIYQLQSKKISYTQE